MISTERLLDVFVEIADTLVDDFDLIDFLHTLTEHAADVCGGLSVGLLLADEHGRLVLMAGSDSDARHLEDHQLQAALGPCVECFTTGRQVVVPDLADAHDRWPDFLVHAREVGIGSVHAFPLRLRDRAIGALNIFGPSDQTLPVETIGVVQALADVATIALIQERAASAAQLLSAQLQGALNSRVLIEQAKGAVAQSRGISVDEAFDAMRAHARAHRLRLGDLAQGVVDRTVDPVTFVS